jgi:hypothetical protein
MNLCRTAAATAVVLATSCGGRPGAPTPLSIDPALEPALIAATAIDRPMRIIFDWRLEDRDGRFSGQGVLRVEPGRARLDLFGPRSESYLSAVLDGLALRLPEGADGSQLPPPPLFWTVLGVLTPPPAAGLVGAQETGSRAELRYGRAGDAWAFSFEDGRLARAEWTGTGSGRRTVELEGSTTTGTPLEAKYRDWPAFLELVLSATQVARVDGFPDDTWILPAN